MKNPRSSVALWRGIALTSSTLAVLLSLVGSEWQRPKLDRAAPAASGARLNTTPVEQPREQASRESPELSTVTKLGEAGDEAALDALIALTTHSSSEVTSAALNAIAKIGGGRAREFLAQRMSSATDTELADLAMALAILGDAEARAVLRVAVESPRPAARTAARDALATLDTPDVRQFMLDDLRRSEPSQAASYFSQCQDSRAIPALIQLARGSDSDLSKAAIVALFAQGPSGLASIGRLLQEGGELADAVLDAPTRTAAAHQELRAAAILRLRRGAVTSGPSFDFLARDLSAEARQALVQAARDTSTAESAIDALRDRGDSASLSALTELAEDSDPELAGPAACALVSAPDSRSRGALIRAERGTLRALAAAALLEINAPEAASAVARLDPNEQIAIRRKIAGRSHRLGLGS